MTTSMTVLAPDRYSHEMSGLSFTQLEGTLIAANILLDAWRTTISSPFDRSRERPSRADRNPVCP